MAAAANADAAAVLRQRLEATTARKARAAGRLGSALETYMQQAAAAFEKSLSAHSSTGKRFPPDTSGLAFILSDDMPIVPSFLGLCFFLFFCFFCLSTGPVDMVLLGQLQTLQLEVQDAICRLARLRQDAPARVQSIARRRLERQRRASAVSGRVYSFFF